MPDCPFPPERKKRSYMMDVSDSDIATVPDLSRLARLFEGVEPIEVIPPEAWEPWDGASHEPRTGLLLTYLLIPRPEPDAPLNWRTPCTEEHAIVVHLFSREDRAPVIVCPVQTWEEHSRHGPAPQAPGTLLLQMPGAEEDAFAWLATPRAVTYRQLVHHCRGPKSGLRLTATYAGKLEATFARLMAGRRPQGRRRDQG